MKKEKRNNKLEILLTDTELKQLEEFAKKINIPKSTLARNLIFSGLKDAELLHKLGFFKIAEIILRIQNEALREEKQIKELITN